METCSNEFNLPPPPKRRHFDDPSRLLPNGKKTKGRVKIKMEYIDYKLRRYTTFSKRKTGIMKKAYELSTLTGTQVMLLVASETGHVYTFATKKLQPIITSDAGKSLIQTCLNKAENGVSDGPDSVSEMVESVASFGPSQNFNSKQVQIENSPLLFQLNSGAKPTQFFSELPTMVTSLLPTVSQPQIFNSNAESPDSSSSEQSFDSSSATNISADSCWPHDSQIPFSPFVSNAGAESEIRHTL